MCHLHMHLTLMFNRAGVWNGVVFCRMRLQHCLVRVYIHWFGCQRQCRFVHVLKSKRTRVFHWIVRLLIIESYLYIAYFLIISYMSTGCIYNCVFFPKILMFFISMHRIFDPEHSHVFLCVGNVQICCVKILFCGSNLHLRVVYHCNILRSFVHFRNFTSGTFCILKLFFMFPKSHNLYIFKVSRRIFIFYQNLMIGKIPL
ncbi:hypothetical protein ACF0H5_006774 [Mactra antiquata]